MTPREIIAEWWPSRIPNARGIAIDPELRDGIAGELLGALDSAGYEIVRKPIAPWAVDWSNAT